MQAIKECFLIAPQILKDKNGQIDVAVARMNNKFADRIPAYLENCRQNANLMLDALDQVDFETLTILGHQMSGSGGMFGFQELTDIGTALEQAARSGDTAASSRQVSELFSCLDRVATDSGCASSTEFEAEPFK